VQDGTNKKTDNHV